MKVLIVSGNPKDSGLCAEVTEQILLGAQAGGAETELVFPKGVERCHVCADGWGNCRTSRRCIFGGDGFDELREKVDAADALCFVTPVYWGEVTEMMKGFLDRLRRCESPFIGESKGLAEKQTLLVASAGGTGNGTISALEQLDRFCQHTAAPVFDRFSINRWNSDYKKTALFAAAKAIAEGRKNGDTV